MPELETNILQSLDDVMELIAKRKIVDAWKPDEDMPKDEGYLERRAKDLEESIAMILAVQSRPNYVRHANGSGDIEFFEAVNVEMRKRGHKGVHVRQTAQGNGFGIDKAISRHKKESTFLRR